MLYCYCFLILNGQILVEPLVKLVYRLIAYAVNQNKGSTAWPKEKTVLLLLPKRERRGRFLKCMVLKWARRCVTLNKYILQMI